MPPQLRLLETEGLRGIRHRRGIALPGNAFPERRESKGISGGPDGVRGSAAAPWQGRADGGVLLSGASDDGGRGLQGIPAALWLQRGGGLWRGDPQECPGRTAGGSAAAIGIDGIWDGCEQLCDGTVFGISALIDLIKFHIECIMTAVKTPMPGFWTSRSEKVNVIVDIII